jgi:hypothetical protein
MEKLKEVYKTLQPEEKPTFVPKIVSLCICSKPAKYRCPQCSKALCSLKCYRNHNSECTQNFYKEQTIAQMQSTKATPEETKSMKKILYQQYSNANEECEYDFKEREEHLLTKIEGGDITCLNNEEKNEFTTYLRSITQFDEQFEQWTPYWEEV